MAATTSLTLLAGAGAVGLNTSLVSGSGDDGVGEISPIDATIPSTEVVDGTDPCATTTLPGVSTGEDEARESTGDENRCAGENGDRHEQETEYEYEYEGAEDDD